jgi:uncharacterized cupredoxin-like copper-binding protein
MQLLRALAGFVLVASLVGMPGVAGASQPDAKKTRTVNVKLLEFKVKPTPVSVEAGTVRFRVRNIGSEEHEFVVVKADTALPTASDGAVDEDAIPDSAKFGEVEELKPKRSGTLTVKSLPAGHYVLFCNIVDKESNGTKLSHYAQGMSTTFSAG